MGNSMEEAFAGIDLTDFPKDSIAEILKNDKQINGGRIIVSQKRNELFTGQFEKLDLDEFLKIWRKYRKDTGVINNIRELLTQQANAMITNYRGQVCPIEVMLYTSNIVANRFNDRRLLTEVSEVVFDILCRDDKYLQSVKHILEVWKWEQAINVCEIAVGKFAANKDNDEILKLLQFIYNNFHYQEVVRYGCFRALMESKNENFALDIISMVHDFIGTEEDKQMGKIFKENFGLYFPNQNSRLSQEMFKDSKPYVQTLVGQMISNRNTLVDQYQNATSKNEQYRIIEFSLNMILKDDRKISKAERGGTMYEAANVLKIASTESISEQLFTYLNLNGSKRQFSREKMMAIICTYFGSINYLPAIKAFMKIPPENEYYAAARVALFYHDRISSDDIVRDFLTETRPERIKIYLQGFFNLKDRVPLVRASTVSYMTQDLNNEKISVAIANYYQLIKKYRYLYDSQVGEVITMWLGYGAVLNPLPLRIQDQMNCLNVIETIITESNKKYYEGFLYHVAEQQDMDFPLTVSNLAKRILESLPTDKIKG